MTVPNFDQQYLEFICILSIDYSHTSKVINEIEQRQLSWYGHVQRMSDNRMSKQAMN